MEFKKYSSLENHYRTAFVEKCAINYGDVEWVASEKIHGANFSLWYNGLGETKCAKRNGFIPELENFYNHLNFYDEFNAKMKVLHAFVLAKFELHEAEVVVYGEIYGPGVQKGIDYGVPKSTFAAFDISVNGYLVDFNAMVDCLTIANIPMVPLIARGSLNDLLALKNDFNTTLNPVEDNVAEGLVIRPVEVKYFGNGERAIIKSKNSKWSEKAQKAGPIIRNDTLSEEHAKVLADLEGYLTVNRLKSVMSKFGSEVTSKDFGRIMGSLMQDAYSEFNRDEYAISAESWGAIKRKVERTAQNLVRENFANILDGSF